MSQTGPDHDPNQRENPNPVIYRRHGIVDPNPENTVVVITTSFRVCHIQKIYLLLSVGLTQSA